MSKLLNNVTLINVNTINAKLAVNILNFCSKLLSFKKTILFSNNKPDNITQNISYIFCDINSIENYNEFILTKLNNYIDTSHCLIIQNDGFIINPHMWQDMYLDYDYIGAPWNKLGMKVWNRTNRIGNGGFSLRSKKLLSYTQKLNNFNFKEPEDVVTSILIENNKEFKYPSVEVAATFSLEDPLEDFPYDFNKCFGFHGKYGYNNLIQLCPNVLKIKNL